MEKKIAVEEPVENTAAVEAPKAKKTTTRSAAKSSSTKTAAAKKPATATKRTAAKKTVKETVYLQFKGNEIDMAGLLDIAKKEYAQAKEGAKDASDVHLYVKPEEGKAYYVINDTFAGEIALF